MQYRLYLAQVGTLLGATAIAQAINFALYPLLARTYDSAAFGHFSIFMSAVSIIGPLAAGRFDVVVQATPSARRHAALSLATLISVPVSVLSAVGYGFAGPDIGLPTGAAAMLFGIAVFLHAFTFTGTAFLVRQEAYRLNGQAIVVRTALTGIPQLALFWLMPDARGLVIGFCVGILAQAVMLHNGIRRLGAKPARGRRLKALLSRYRQYPVYDVPATFLSTFTLYAANFFLFDLYGPREAGFFSFAFRLAALPMALLAGSLGEVFFQKAAKSFRAERTFWKPLRFNLAVTSGCALAIFVATLLLARPAVRIYLGADWDPVATILIILAPMMAGRFLFLAVAAAPLVTGRTGWLLAANASLAAATLGTYVVARVQGLGMEHYLSLYSLVTSLLYAMLVAAITLAVFRLDRRVIAQGT